MEQMPQAQAPTMPQAMPQPLRLAAAPAKKSFIGRLAGAVASHPYLSLAIIIVLLVVVIGLVVYYRGFLFLGPYAAGPRGHRPPRKKRNATGEEAGEEPAGDPETESLIASINQR